MSNGKILIRVLVLSFVSLFLVGVGEFLLKVDPATARSSDHLLEVTLIVGAAYGAIGALGAVFLMAAFSLLRLAGMRARLEYSPFLLWSFVAFAYSGYEVNTKWLRGIPMSHPESLIATLVLFIICVLVFYILYRFARGTVLRSLFGIVIPTILTLSTVTPTPTLRAAEDPTPDHPVSGKETGTNLLLITIDTLRPDHLGCYGHEGIRTPVIDGLAREGVLFENAVTSIPVTLPSHTSIMTGLYPPTHGIRYNGAFALADSIVTLAEVLRDNGYTTGAVVGSYALDSEFGLDQGFEHYDDAYPSGNIFKFKFPELWPALTHLLLSRVLVHLLPLDMIASEPQRRADKVTDAALDWLETHGKEKFFLWVHYFDPHAPYDPPPVKGLGRPRTSIPNRALVSHPPPYRYWWGDLNRLEDVYLRYDGEIEYTDHWLGRLIDEIEWRLMRKNTLIVIASDHGECLWEHDLAGHGYSVYDSELRVPLILVLPGVIPADTRIEEQVELVDLFPSILDILGVEVTGPIQGRSLLALIDGRSTAEERPAYCETLWPTDPNDRVKGIRTREWKYISRLGGGPGLLFHLTTDPNELRNLYDERPDLVGIFDAQLAEMGDRIGDGNVRLPEMDEDVKDRLRALGYVR